MDTKQPEALRLAAELDETPDFAVDPNMVDDLAAELRRQHAYCQELEAQVIRDCMTHVQNPAENEHVADDMSKNGAGSNAPQPAPPADSVLEDAVHQVFMDRGWHDVPASDLWMYPTAERWQVRTLYFTPQPTQAQAGAVPLTDEQIKDLQDDGVFLGTCRQIVRAIEAAHGIGETP